MSFTDEISPSTFTEVGPSTIAMAYHLRELGLHVMYWVSEPTGVPLMESVLKQVYGSTSNNPDYGKTFVYIGYVSGGEVGMAAFAANMRGGSPNDYYGNSLYSLPMLIGINSARDWDVSIMGSTLYYFSLIDVPYNLQLKSISISTGPHGAEVQSYYQKNVIVGYLLSSRGGSEYELLTKHPGAAIASMDAQSLTHLLLIGSIIIGNVAFIASKRVKEGKK